MARANGVTCRECGCLNFSSEHEVCDKCRSNSPTFRPTARRSSNSHGSVSASNSRRNENAHSNGKKRRYDATPNASNKQSDTPPKKHPDVIDLISDDDEDVVVQKVVHKPKERHDLFQSRVFPTMAFYANDFPTIEEGTMMRKKMVDKDLAHSQSTVRRATTLRTPPAASQPIPQVQDKTEPTPPIKEKEIVAKTTQNEIQADATSVDRQKQSEVEDSEVGPMFQSRVFDSVEFHAADFATVFDGLATYIDTLLEATWQRCVSAAFLAISQHPTPRITPAMTFIPLDPSKLTVCVDLCPTQQKKGAKQATMFSFFSPKKPGQESDENTAESEAKSAAAQGASPAAKTEVAANSVAKTAPEGKKKAVSAKAKAKAKLRAKAKGKTKASPKLKPKTKKEPIRFTSPHAVDDEDDDVEDGEDVFNTPEAKRARAELETGGDIVPAGALISGDAVVEDTDIVDVSDDDATANGIGGEDAGTKDADESEKGVVDLTAAAENNDKKPRGKAPTRTPAARNSKTPTKTPSKRLQKMKQKAAAEAKPTPVEPLDPAIQARVDTYKLKTDELTRQYSDLFQSKQERDAIMQDIYGAGLDCDLDVIVDHKKAQHALVETWQKLRTQAHRTNNAADAALPSSVEFPHEAKCLIVKGIQGRTASLSEITSDLLTLFKKNADDTDVNMESQEQTSSFDTVMVNKAVSLALEMEIKMLAQRTPHGVRPTKANLFEDTSAEALWAWEVGNLEKYFADDAQKVVKRMRKHRKRLGQQLKTLARVVQLLHQKPVDAAKVSGEEAKVAKFGFAVDAELQKAKEKEAKEQGKRNAVEEKRRHELERQQAKEAKDEEKLKRKREEEEKKKGMAAKRQKMFSKLFKAPPANSAGTSVSAIDMTGDHDMEKTMDAVEDTSAKIAKMDAAISFLGFSGDASSSSPRTVSHQSIFSSLKGKRDAISMQGDKFYNGWSAQRHRDSKLGGMKLLQFYENNRPAYYGTFSTRSLLFRGGRRPLAQYSKFDYTVDSDDEWEEEEPGESLSDDDNDGEESDEDNLDYEDQWLAYEDEVDYMDDVNTEDDPMELGEGQSLTTKHKLPSQLQKKRLKAKAVKPAKLEPQIIGPFWYSDNENSCGDGHSSGSVGELLCEPVFESTLMRKAREYEEEQERLEAVRQEQQQKKEQQEQEKLIAQEKKAQEAKEKAAADIAKPVVKTGKSTPVMPTSTPQKATPHKVAPQKTSTQMTSAKQSAASLSPAKSTAAASSSSSPTAPQIDSFFKKMTGPVPVPPKPQQPKATDEQKPKDGSVEVITVD
ncbi:hypothetical protein PHMEG_00010898 [Phytophthora megakarya]|uniref:Chromatin assembly factor 1 subunit A dimerization domain-containing protein n=1 Tax=Phytophthora megakarya TaxID=4795 RepID=A0A225WCJ6_9STRA|nr:hypothetical protein PHMEG_00010898 [Phytophthora megakarya]